MSFCLGKRLVQGPPIYGPRNPRTHALCQEKRRSWAGQKKSELRNRQLNLSLTDAELTEIERRARAVGMRPVHFGRALVLADDRRSGPTSAAACTQDRLVYNQLSRLGNLLNQMVRHLHQTGDLLPADLEPLLRDIRQILARRVL